MKIDLDDLEPKRWRDEQLDAARFHIAANSPPVTLALIERIRRLEGTIGDIADAMHTDGRWPKTERDLRALLEKGVIVDE